MKIAYSVTENSYAQQVSAVLIIVFAALVLCGLPLLAKAADLSIRIHERGGKSMLQGVSVCLGTPADPDQFGK